MWNTTFVGWALVGMVILAVICVAGYKMAAILRKSEGNEPFNPEDV